MLGMLAALMFAGWSVARRQATGMRRAIVVGYLIFVSVAVVSWAGLDRIVARFAEGGMAQASGRLGIWGDTWTMVRRFPLVGTGLNTFGTATIFYQTVDLQKHFAQAHNDYLQLLAEGGALVFVPATLAVAAVAWTIRRRLREESVDSSGYWIRIGAVTGILAIALQEAADFSLQMPGNALLFTVLVAVVVRAQRRTLVSGADRTPAIPRNMRDRAELL